MKKSGKAVQSTERVLKIDRLFTEGIILDSTDEIEDSLMYREYCQAGEMVCQIVKRNEQLLSQESSRGKRRPWNTGVENIISFVGERGMGKTSVMRSFIEFLAQENTCKTSVKDLLAVDDDRNLLDSVCFVPLRYIDVSILKSSEDVMEIILARMYRYVRDLIYRAGGQATGMADREETRALFRKFEQVYQAIMTLNEKSTLDPGESALLRLQTLNSSFSLSDSFQDLVNSFLKFTTESRGFSRDSYGSYAQTSYLVIALDDVDRYMPDQVSGMPRKGVYTLLGQIDEYLKVPGIIVLMAYDDALLKINCRTYIKEKYQFNDADAENNQVNQYLTKIIPARQKIYMPNLAWKDRPEVSRLVIEIEKESQNQPFPKLWKKLEDGTNLSFKLLSKQFTLCYLAEQYGCFFDTVGLKKHFFEEHNLRRLTELVLMLQLTDEEKGENRSYSKLISYIYNQFKSTFLTVQEAALFNEWMEKPIDRRSHDIISYIRSRHSNDREERENTDEEDSLDARISIILSGGRLQDKKKERKRVQRRDLDWRYSYGELLYNLYQSTRAEDGREQVFSKKMAQRILASYSVVLPYLAKNSEIDLLKRVVGSSVAGQWANSFLPWVTATTDKEHSENQDKTGKINFILFKKVGAYDIRTTLNSFMRIPIDKKYVSEENLNYLIPAIELFSMFFTQLEKDNMRCGYDWKWETERGNEEEEKFILEIGADSACFNIFNFVVNSFDLEDFFASIHASLISLIEQLGKSNDDAKQLVEEKSLKKEFEVWQEDHGRFAMPFQHFDMMYNIMKRQQNNRLVQEIKPKDFLKQCAEVYRNISEALRNQDKFYEECLSDEKKPRFQDKYNENPFIDYICNLFETNDRSKNIYNVLNELLTTFLYNLVTSEGNFISP